MLNSEEPDEIIDRTPEAAPTASDRWRANRFCRLKKTATSISSLRSLKSSTSVVALVTSTPTPSSLSPKSKRGKFDTTPEKIKEKDFDDVSPVAVCERSPPKSEKISKIENEELLKLVRTQKTSSKVSLETLEIFSKNEAETPSPSAILCPPSVNEKPLSHKYGRHRVVDVLRPQGRYGEIDVRLESDDAEKKPVRCILRGSWANTDLYEGDVVNLVNVIFILLMNKHSLNEQLWCLDPRTIIERNTFERMIIERRVIGSLNLAFYRNSLNSEVLSN